MTWTAGWPVTPRSAAALVADRPEARGRGLVGGDRIVASPAALTSAMACSWLAMAASKRRAAASAAPRLFVAMPSPRGSCASRKIAAAAALLLGLAPAPGRVRLAARVVAAAPGP